MKILYLTSGGNIHDFRFLKKFKEFGIKIFLLHYSKNSLINDIHKLNLEFLVHKKPKILPSFPLLSQIGHFRKIVNEFKPDIIHSGYVWQVGILPAMLNLHPHLSMPWGSDILVEPDKYYFIKLLVSKVMMQCDHISCDAKFVKERIVNNYKIDEGKITVFPWGVNMDVFKKYNKMKTRNRLNLSENKYILIMTRNFTPIYNIEFFINSIYKLRTIRSDFIVLLIGSGPLESKIKKLVNKLNLKDVVKLVGFVNNCEMPYYLSAADVYVSTSISDGTSLSLLEAFACGLPAIVTKVPAVLEWVNNHKNGIVIEQEDESGFVQETSILLDDRNKRKEMGEMNYSIAQTKANWDQNFEILISVYEKLSKCG
ncbi:D-inositol-3-phosphate glycosyltransferase [subsurface metagenome]